MSLKILNSNFSLAIKRGEKINDQLKIKNNVKEKTIEIIHWGILAILASSAGFTSLELLYAYSEGGNVVISSGGIKLTPKIFASNMLFVTLVNILVAILAIITLRRARMLHSKGSENS